MKKLLTTLLIMLLVLSVVSPAYAEENSVTALSDLSEQECIAFIKVFPHIVWYNMDKVVI